MTFAVGETVVYPNHGAAVIEDIETRTIRGEDKLYLVQASTMSNNEPTYLGAFIRSFELTTT